MDNKYEMLYCNECLEETVHEWDPEFEFFVCSCGAVWDEYMEGETERLHNMMEHINE